MRYKGHIIKGRPVDNAGHVREGDVFICLEGARHDGHRFIPEACRLGASLIVSEKKITGCPVRCLRVKNARVCLAELSNLYYRNPSRKLSLVGITGTNGKTTISYLIRNMLKSAGIESSLIGTNAHYIGTTKIVSANTTPGHLDINKILRESLRWGIREGVMEVSSHALIQNRIGGIEFKYRIFSNNTLDITFVELNRGTEVKALVKTVD